MRGVGTDAVEIERVRELLARHGERFRARIFTPGEQAAARARGSPGEAAALAARWAAKEAFIKAVGNARVAPLDIEIAGGGARPPTLVLSGSAAAALAAAGARAAHVSLARAGECALALVAIA